MCKKRGLFRLLGWVLVALGVGLGCGEDNRTSSLTGPPVFEDLRIVSGNNQAGKVGEPLSLPLQVEAVDRQGRPVEGVAVRFSVAGGGGVLSDTTGVTGAVGRVQTRLTLGPLPGVNRVTVAVEGLVGLPPTFTALAEGEALEDGVVQAPVSDPNQRPDAAHFSLSVERLNLPGGVEFGLMNPITAFVFNAASNPVQAGTEVRFRTDGGGIEASGRTDAAGRVTVNLTTAAPVPEGGFVTVTAETRGGGDSLLTAQTQVLFSGPTRVRLIQPANFAVSPGASQAFLLFVGDDNGNPLSEGTQIRVTAVGGTVSGQTNIRLPDTQSPDLTRFSVLFQATEEGPTPRMTIDVTSPNGDQRLILVSGTENPAVGGGAVEPVAVSVDVADSVLVADGTSVTQVTATVTDSMGNGVPNEPVRFTASAGTVDASALTDASGRATVAYRSAVNPSGVLAVTVEAGVRSLVAQTTLRLLGVRLVLVASPETIAADGVSLSTITATLTTEEVVPVPFVRVDFGATLGTLSATEVETDVTGRASVVYTSVASPSNLGTVAIRARTTGLDASVGLVLLGVEVVLSALPDTIAADGNAQSTLRVRLRRSDGVVIPNGQVQFETTLGTLSSTMVETDAEGVAETILVAGTDEGKATVVTTYGGGLTQRASVAFVKGPPASIIVVSVVPPTIGVRGAGANETAIVTFEVRDDRGNTVADGEPIFFRLDVPSGGDEQIGPDSTATVNGRVQAALSSGTVARTVRLIAEAATGDRVRSNPVPIAIYSGLPDQDHFSISVDPVNLAGRVVFGLESTVTAFVFDKFSNPVPVGTSVQFQTNGGGIQGAVETNAVGQGQVTLFTANPIPPAPAFLATITAQTVDENGREITTTNTVLFSGPTDEIQLTGAGGDTIRAGRLFIADGANQIITFSVSDITGFPLMGGSVIEVTSDVGRLSGDANIVMPDVRAGHTDYAIVVADPVPLEDPPQPPQSGSVLIQVRSRNGNAQLTFGLSVD